jgi:RNA polymerase sigma-70 factor (ECF subfamily)
MLMRFVSAVRGGDLAGLELLLAKDAKAVTDAGGHASAALRIVRSRSKVARFFRGLAKKAGDTPLAIEPVNANRWPALLITRGKARQFVTIETDGTSIRSVFVIMNPEKLAAFA